MKFIGLRPLMILLKVSRATGCTAHICVATMGGTPIFLGRMPPMRRPPHKSSRTEEPLGYFRNSVPNGLV